MASSREIVQRYYDAFDNHDFAAARALMHDQFQFRGPMMEASSPEELLGKMQAFECAFTNHVVRMVEDGSTVAVLFDCAFTHPFAATIRMSEWFTVEDDKLVASTLVYDTRQMPAMPAE